MNNKGILKILLIFVEMLFIASCQGNEAVHIITFNEDQKELLENYILIKNYNIEIIDNENYLTLSKVDEKILIDILNILYIKIEIIKNNIVNVNTTRTTGGGPFKRKYLKITAEKGVEIIEDTENDIRLVYDLTHPDSMREGDHIGFVQFPNVDINTEYYDLVETIQLYNGFIDYIKNNYKHIIVDKINIMSIEEIEHNSKIEKILNLILKFSYENTIKNNN
jgi:flagellar basal-body rod protein FlgC